VTWEGFHSGFMALGIAILKWEAVFWQQSWLSHQRRFSECGAACPERGGEKTGVQSKKADFRRTCIGL
jgi:hypothetical protein